MHLITNLQQTIPTTAAQIVDNQTGKMICVGFFEPSELLIEITVVGIICKDAVFKTINIIILSHKVYLSLLSFCNSFIAFNPKGVAAFPSPNILATIFIIILL